jgi:hypothetical protein
MSLAVPPIKIFADSLYVECVKKCEPHSEGGSKNG